MRTDSASAKGTSYGASKWRLLKDRLVCINLRELLIMVLQELVWLRNSSHSLMYKVILSLRLRRMLLCLVEVLQTLIIGRSAIVDSRVVNIAGRLFATYRLALLLVCGLIRERLRVSCSSLSWLLRVVPES